MNGDGPKCARALIRSIGAVESRGARWASDNGICSAAVEIDISSSGCGSILDVAANVDGGDGLKGSAARSRREKIGLDGNRDGIAGIQSQIGVCGPDELEGTDGGDVSRSAADSCICLNSDAAWVIQSILQFCHIQI